MARQLLGWAGLQYHLLDCTAEQSNDDAESIGINDNGKLVEIQAPKALTIYNA